MKLKRFTISAIILLFLSASLSAQSRLDRILNNMVLDAYTPNINREIFKVIEPHKPLGQTFTTGSNIVEISRIAVAVAYWNESWQESESLVVTIYDSPQKNKILATDKIPYSRRAWDHQVLMFYFDLKVQPNKEYYFELTVDGGDSVINGIFTGGSYNGQAYEGVNTSNTNIWFEIHSRPVFDRDAAYADRFSMFNLNYPGLEEVKKYVNQKNWDSAVDELIKFYENRKDLFTEGNVSKPMLNPDFDTSELDKFIFEYKLVVDDGEIIDLGPRYNHWVNWAKKGGIGFTRVGLHRYFRAAYQNTTDEKYAKAYDDFLFYFFNDIPSPIRSGYIKPDQKEVPANFSNGIGGGRMWDGLGLAARIGLTWWNYGGFINSPNLTRDMRAAMIFNVHDMGALLSRMQAGGNWEATIGKAVFDFGDQFPESTYSDKYFKQGLNIILSNIEDTLHPDGSSWEASANYHNIIVNRYLSIFKRCKELNIEIEKKYKDLVEKSVDFILYTLQPDWNAPARGDSGFFSEPLDHLRRGGEYFNRLDFIWAGSRGTEGTKPSKLSYAFDTSGWFVMRSGWNTDSLYLNIHNGPNRGHGHYDALSLIVMGYGERFIVDPGITTYGTPEADFMTSTKAHATITVDGRDTRQDFGKNTFGVANDIEYIKAENAGYNGLNDVKHTRTIVFVKDDYWAVFDEVNGIGEYEITSRFPFAPGILNILNPSGLLTTLNENANLLLVPENGHKMNVEEYTHQIDSKIKDAPAVLYTTKTSLPFKHSQLLLPYRGKEIPNASIRKIVSGFYEIKINDRTDYIAIGNIDNAYVSFNGKAVCITYNKDGNHKIRNFDSEKVYIKKLPIQ
ncbi:MAG: alginate lyase family protein [Armatimonadota bacterium]